MLTSARLVRRCEIARVLLNNLLFAFSTSPIQTISLCTLDDNTYASAGVTRYDGRDVEKCFFFLTLHALKSQVSALKFGHRPSVSDPVLDSRKTSHRAIESDDLLYFTCFGGRFASKSYHCRRHRRKINRLLTKL